MRLSPDLLTCRSNVSISELSPEANTSCELYFHFQHFQTNLRSGPGSTKFHLSFHSELKDGAVR